MGQVAMDAYDVQIKELIGQMTIDEKLDQLDEDFQTVDWEKLSPDDREYCQEHLKKRLGDSHTYNILQRYALEHTRLKIPYLIHEEALHGLCRPDCTVYPQQMTLGCTFDPSLARKMGEGIAEESRAKGIHEVWAPVLDLARDPRWGRTEETYGEDTYLSSRMGEAVVKGLQGDNPEQELKDDRHVMSELKHFTAYGAPTAGLNCAPTAIGRREAESWCLPVFEAAVRAGAFNAMASYNSIDGVPVIADHSLLTGTLRDKWGMPGFVRADMTAIIMQHTAHMSAESPKEALRRSVKAGVDVQLYDYPHEEYRRLMKELLADGSITMEDVDRSVARVLLCKFALGLFEQPFAEERLEKERVHNEAHRAVALEIAQKGAVLLKNDGILPLSKSIRKLAVIGPNADTPVMGDYHAEPDYEPVTLLDGIRALVSPKTEILTDKGCNILGTQIRPVERWWARPSVRPALGITESDYGFTGEYFNGSDFSGEPVLTRLDPQINFNWIYYPPDERVDSNGFCVRWTAKLRMENTFIGRLGLSSLDSMRLYLDGVLLVDGWDEKDANQMVDVRLEHGKEYDVRIEFRNDARAPRVIFGCDSGEETVDRAVAMAKEADVAIVALGDSPETSGENFDRTTLDLSGGQLEFLKKVYDTGTPVVLVLNTGRPVSCTWENEHLNAILQAGFNGEMGGQATAEILFGDVNPSGRLTMSYPKTVGQIPCHYSRKPAGGKKYVEMDWNPLYSFGYGLSYTRFAYEGLRLSAREIAPDGRLSVFVTVTNEGERYGEEIVQLYVNDRFTSIVSPVMELKGFCRVGLAPGESRQVEFALSFDELKLLNADFKWVVEPGEFEVMIGKNAGEILRKDSFWVK